MEHVSTQQMGVIIASAIMAASIAAGVISIAIQMESKKIALLLSQILEGQKAQTQQLAALREAIRTRIGS